MTANRGDGQIFNAKTALKTWISRAGMGHAYHDNFWRLRAAAGQVSLTPWQTKHRAIFIHIPKNAGTSISKSFNMPEAVDAHVPVAGYRWVDRKFFNSALTFAVVRNPWDRLVSAFHYLKFKPLTAGDRSWGEQHLGRFATCQDFLATLSNQSFAAFVLTWRHFMPQTYFISEWHGGICVQELLRFETLDADLNHVRAKLGMEVELQESNRSPRVDYQSYYTEETRRNVERLYSSDVKQLGYHF